MDFLSNLYHNEENNLLNYLQVSKSVINKPKNGEDMAPQDYLNTNNNKQAFIVADGHGGDSCTQILNNNYEKILKIATETNTIEAINFAKELCKSQKSGAMIIIALYDPYTNNIEISSMGDCSANIYQNGECVHSQPKHNNYYDVRLKNFDINVYKQNIKKYLIDKNGIFHLKNGIRRYFRWKNYKTEIATSSAIGHFNVSNNSTFNCLPPITTNYNVGKYPFHIIMNSDGIDDVIHNENKIMKDILMMDISKYKNYSDYIANSALNIWNNNITTIYDTINNKYFHNCKPYRTPDDISVLVAYKYFINP
jgi:serine/threonine protein phosphatase PrpC